ncbi:hypothetical protein [Kitasatospora sp. CB01950]|nr:hypothetical protein [Kitasatospora sp. CB01950]
MTKTRPSGRRDVFHALRLTAPEAPLLCAAPYAFALPAAVLSSALGG